MKHQHCRSTHIYSKFYSYFWLISDLKPKTLHMSNSNNDAWRGKHTNYCCVVKLIAVEAYRKRAKQGSHLFHWNVSPFSFRVVDQKKVEVGKDWEQEREKQRGKAQGKLMPFPPAKLTGITWKTIRAGNERGVEPLKCAPGDGLRPVSLKMLSLQMCRQAYRQTLLLFYSYN